VDWAPNAPQNEGLRIIFGILKRGTIQEKSRCFFDNSCVRQWCAVSLFGSIGYRWNRIGKFKIQI